MWQVTAPTHRLIGGLSSLTTPLLRRQVLPHHGRDLQDITCYLKVSISQLTEQQEEITSVPVPSSRSITDQVDT